MTNQSNVTSAHPAAPDPLPCGHPCRCHAINPHHICDQPRNTTVLNCDEESAIFRVLAECGREAAVEVVNRLLKATATHQYEAGFRTGERWERAAAQSATEARTRAPSAMDQKPRTPRVKETQ